MKGFKASELRLTFFMRLDGRKNVQSVKSAWSSFHIALKDHVLPTILGNNKEHKINTHSYPCSLFMFVVCYHLYFTSVYSLFGYPSVLPLYN